MIRNLTLIGVLAGTALGAGVLAQETRPAPEAGEQQRGKADEATIRRWIEQLGAEASEARQQAEQELRDVGEPARAALEQAAEDHEDPEVRWRARRVLRSLDGDQPRLERREIDPEAQQSELDDLDARLREMSEQLEEAFGEDFGRLRGFEDFHRRMQEITRRFERMEDMLGPRFGVPAPGSGRFSESRGVKIEMGPQGVRVELQEEGEDGQPKTRTYEAESLEAFREKHPEIAQRYLDGGGLRIRGFGGDWFGFGQPRPPETLRPRGRQPGPGTLEVVPSPEEGPPPALGERLGVYIAELPQAVREYLELPPDVGLLVESVEDGSLAATLGLQPKDVLLKIGDRQLVERGDVAAALRTIRKGEEVVVSVNRRGESLELRAEKEHDAPSRKLQPKERVIR